MKKNFKRKGFTLVELLIVIVVIGVLSAMMMISSTEAVSSAKATKIINDMTQLKKATTAWYSRKFSQNRTKCWKCKRGIWYSCKWKYNSFQRFYQRQWSRGNSQTY
ncbi:MAG: type II secretion system protein [Synergistales bacterium]|nr:type II secretion system protein [Synergistales bacterium]MDY6401371.1 type II secretion system protein [Synergistales bacterium]MDY6405046.1 type II secretion system protein [Synergistales bacterium]MDY6410117.1 type II secretion system protein [Synergistales bacterium]MDY6413905.1 type II secretion system protein [Synergistales bacterium]